MRYEYGGSKVLHIFLVRYSANPPYLLITQSIAITHHHARRRAISQFQVLTRGEEGRWDGWASMNSLLYCHVYILLLLSFYICTLNACETQPWRYLFIYCIIVVFVFDRGSFVILPAHNSISLPLYSLCFSTLTCSFHFLVRTHMRSPGNPQQASGTTVTHIALLSRRSFLRHYVISA